MKTWRLIETGLGSAEWNMAVDEAIFNSYKEHDLPVLRVYQWTDSLSFGRYQKAEKSIDLEKLKLEKLSCVRRMTGGGVLAHGGDLSYSLIIPKSLLGEMSVKESYGYLCGFLIELYKKLGLSALFSRDLKIESKRSDICMSANEEYDIVIEGKKIGGNAQRHTKRVLFQHGSIPIRFDKERLEPFFLEESGLENAATLHNLGVFLSYDELSGHLIEAFCKNFGTEVEQTALSQTEKECAKKLEKEQYADNRWNTDAL